MNKFFISAAFVVGLAGTAAAQTPVSPNPDYPVYVEQDGVQYFCRAGLTTLPDGRSARLCRRLTDLLAASNTAGLPAAIGGGLLTLAIIAGQEGGGGSSGTGTR